MAQLTPEQRRQLDEEGYILLRGVLSPDEVEAVRDYLEALWRAEGKKAGSENYMEEGARRLANLTDKGDIFRPIFGHRLVLEGVEAVMGPQARLSMLNARDVPPGHDPEMPMHRDTEGNRGKDEQGFHAATAIWMLDPFTKANGATRLVPGTHEVLDKPGDVLEDPLHHPDEMVVEARPGDVLLFNGHCWHTGGANDTDRHRRAILAHYVRADIPLRSNRRQYLSPETAARMTPAELELLGVETA